MANYRRADIDCAKITHHYLSVRETALRPVSWHPFKIFANGQAS
ncbi:MAG: hypothetical protein V1928_03135 [Parcubacteria group bacterium]